MWMPQMFAQLNVYDEQLDDGTIEEDEPMATCNIFDYTNAANAASDAAQPSNALFQCHLNIVPAKVYLNSVIIGAGLAVTHFITGLLATRISPRVIFVGGAISAVATSLGLQAAPAFLAPYLAAGLQASLSNTASAGMAACVDLFPTSIRSSAVSLTNMFGRIGSLVGNIVFPMLLNTTCSTAFYGLAGVMALSCVLGFSLPVAEKERSISVDLGNTEEKRAGSRKSITIPPQVERIRATSFNGVPLTIVSLDNDNQILSDDQEEEISEENSVDAKETNISSVSVSTLTTAVEDEERSVMTSNRTLHM